MWPERTRSNAPVGQAVDDPREVAEQDAQVGVRVGELPGPRLAAHVRARVDADELDATAAELERHRLVAEQRAAAEVDLADRLRERVAAVGEVVVAEHGVDRRQPLDQLAQPLRTFGPGEQVAGEHHEVGLPLGDPVDRALDRPHPRRRDAEVEVGEVRDPQPGELRAGARAAATSSSAEPHPGGLVQPPGDAGGRDSGGRGKARADAFARQTESFSTTGVDRDDVPLELQLRLGRARRRRRRAARGG